MKLSKNEHEVKSYTYASMGKLKSNLTVTTKRVIFSKEGKLRGTKIRTSDEINLNSIERVASSATVKSRPALLIFALLFIAVATLVYLLWYKEIFVVATGGVLGLLFLLSFLFNKKRTFFLTFITGLYEGIDLTTNVGATLSNKKKKVKYVKEIRVRLNSSVAQTIVDEIGSVILNAKEYSAYVEDDDANDQETEPPTTEEPQAPVEQVNS